VFTFLTESVGLADEAARHPGIAALTDRCESLPEFTAIRTPWFSPDT
jgi:hypothetical protein